MSRETTKRVKQIVQKRFKCEGIYNELLDDKITRRLRFILKDRQPVAGADVEISNELEEAGIMHGPCFIKQTVSWRGLRNSLYIVMPA